MADELIEIARVVSVAALATDGVHSLGGGRYAEAATYGLGGEKVSGVVVGDEAVEVHIVVAYPLAKPAPEIAQAVRERVLPLAKGRKADVVVEDVVVGEEVVDVGV